MSNDIRARLGLGPRPSYDTNPATNPLLPQGYTPNVGAPPTAAAPYAATAPTTVPSYDHVRHRLGLSQPGPSNFQPSATTTADPLAAERALLASPPPVINPTVLTSTPPPSIHSPPPRVTVPSAYTTPASPYFPSPSAGIAGPTSFPAAAPMGGPTIPYQLYEGEIPSSPPKVLSASIGVGPMLSPSPGRSVPPPPNLHPPHPTAAIEHIDLEEAHCEKIDADIAQEMAARELAAREEEARIRELRAKERAEEIRQLEARAQAEEKASAAQFANLQGKFAAVRDGLMKKRVQSPHHPTILSSPAAKILSPAAVAVAGLSSPSALAPKLDLASEHREHMEKIAQQVKEQTRIAMSPKKEEVKQVDQEQPTASSSSTTTSGESGTVLVHHGGTATSPGGESGTATNPRTTQWELQRALEEIRRLERRNAQEASSAQERLVGVKQEAVAMVTSARTDAERAQKTLQQALKEVIDTRYQSEEQALLRDMKHAETHAAAEEAERRAVELEAKSKLIQEEIKVLREAQQMEDKSATEAQKARDKAERDRESNRVQASLRLEALERLQSESEQDAKDAPDKHRRAMDLAQRELADAQREAQQAESNRSRLEKSLSKERQEQQYAIDRVVQSHQEATVATQQAKAALSTAVGELEGAKVRQAALQQRLAEAEKVAEEQQRQRDSFESELKQAKAEMAQAQEQLQKSNQDLVKVKSERTKDPPPSGPHGTSQTVLLGGKHSPKRGTFVVHDADGGETVVDGSQHIADVAAASAAAAVVAGAEAISAQGGAKADSEWDALRRQYLAPGGDGFVR